jgi:hypothetical protein
MLSTAMALAIGSAHAWQTRPVVIAPPPSVQFQQTVQQQQTNNQLQQSQLQSQLRQSVADQARLPNANNPQAQKQADDADKAQRERDRAEQQALIDRQQAQSQLPRVVPNPPAASHDD